MRLDIITPNGLKDYCSRARNLLEVSRSGGNDFDKYKP
jgi:hypothetical protein